MTQEPRQGKAPCFTLPARQRAVQPELAALDPATEVAYEQNCAGHRSSGVASVQNLVEYIGDIISRQSKGFFNLREAAQILADENPSVNAAALLRKMKTAYHDGTLVVRSVETQAPHEAGAELRDFLDWVTPADVNEMLLRWGVSYRFALGEPRQIVQSGSSESRSGTWPWGTYETKLLRHMADAAARWWVNFDPADDTTAPINDQVSQWLQERGVNKSMSDRMATILRADGLKTGPRT